MLAIAVAEGRTLYSRTSLAKYKRAASLWTLPESQSFGRDSLSGRGPSAHLPGMQAPGPQPGARARLAPAPIARIPSSTSLYPSQYHPELAGGGTSCSAPAVAARQCSASASRRHKRAPCQDGSYGGSASPPVIRGLQNSKLGLLPPGHPLEFGIVQICLPTCSPRQGGNHRAQANECPNHGSTYNGHRCLASGRRGQL